VTSSGTIPLKDVWKMLDAGAHGSAPAERIHNWEVRYNQKTYYRLPLGKHGKRKNPAIQIGHVRNLVRFFEIDACAKGQLEQLR